MKHKMNQPHMEKNGYKQKGIDQDGKREHFWRERLLFFDIKEREISEEKEKMQFAN